MDDIEEILIAAPDYDWSAFDRDEFRRWLEADAPGVLAPHVDLWMRAVDHRHAWTSRRALPSDSPKALVCRFWDIFGAYAWIDKRGVIFPADYASHDRVCDIIIGLDPIEAEKSHARLTRSTRSAEEAWQYVEKPSRKMQETVIKFIRDNLQAFPHMKGF